MKTKILVALLLISFCLSAQTPNNGTIYNGATYSADVPSVLSANTYSLVFNGTTKVTPAPEIVVGDNGAISIWFKKDDINSTQGVIMSSTDGNACIFIQSPNQITVSLRTAAGNQYSYTSTVPLTMSSNTWYHLVLNRTAGVTDLYINNTQGNGAGQVGWLFNLSQVGVHASPSYSFSGKLADMKVFANPLSANDIAALYAGTATTANPLVYWKMNEGSGTTVYDSQGGGCTYSITPSSVSPLSSSGTGSIAVNGSSGCSWTATSNNTDWLTVTSGGTGVANGTVNYSYTANILTTARTGTITVADKTYTITQSGTSASTDAVWLISGNNIYNSNTGNIGIGTANPHEKLSVQGTVLAQKVRVSILSTDWADYVFDKHYKLPSLDQIEKYTKVNKHLPGIPSAQQVVKNGIDLGSNQALLLKKIEEMTLIIISQNKKQQAFDKKLENQNKLISNQNKTIQRQGKEIIELKQQIKRINQ